MTTTPGASRTGSGPVSGRVAAMAVALLLGATSCSAEPDAAPPAEPSPVPSTTSTAPPSAPAPAPVAQMATQVSVGVVAGRLGTRKRRGAKESVTAVVDRYLDGAWVGSYPRTDFSAAFTDFRAPARRDAQGDLSLLTNLDLGAQTTAVSPTRRRLRIDLLAPRGRTSAATARFALDLDTTGAVPGSVRVRGSLLMSNQRGAWSVFGYDVRPEVLP